MRILILSQWYAPEPMRFLPEMAQSLQQLGHDVEVLTGFPNWPDGRIYPGYRVKLRQVETIDGVRVVRAPLFPNHGRSALGRVANLGSFVASAIASGAVNVARPDVIHAIQPPTTCFAAMALGKLWRVPYSYEVQDMWPETLSSTGFVGNRRALAAVGAYCRWVYRTAGAIRVISPGFRRDLIGKGVPADKIALIPNWVDTSFYRPDATAGDTVVPPLPQGFRVLYAGTVGLAQGLDTLLDAAAVLVGASDVQLIVAGDGLELDRLRDNARARGLTNVTFLGRQPMASMPALYASVDACLVMLKKDPLFAMTIPHKTLTYMAAAKPIVASAEGDLAELVESSGVGLAAAPGDGRALAARILDLRAIPAPGREAMARRGRVAACETFGREAMVARLAQMFDAMRPGHRRPADASTPATDHAAARVQ